MSGVEYIAHGWALCNIPPGTKGEKGMDTAWNTEPKAIRDPVKLRDGWSVGLLHAWSGTCALDVDMAPEARAWLEARGVNLDHLLAADDAVQIVSGRNGSAKLLYRLPEGVDPLVTVRITDPEADPKDRAKSTWLEFRCASSAGNTVQDVLPPSVHPGTGKPYRWGGDGDWRALPALPGGLLAIWRDLADETPAERKARGATGPGTSPEVADMVRRLRQADCKPYRCGDGFRGFCPAHGGESGTTFKVDEAANGAALVHCHAGCTWDEIKAKLPPADSTIPRNVTSFQQLKAAQDARKAAKASDTGKLILPAFPEDLLTLPHGLGDLQAWILGYMSYPSPAMAGFTAWATLAHFAMPSIRIDSRRGLGANEQFLLLAPTGFGKEDLRTPFEAITAALQDYPRPVGAGNLWLSRLPAIQHSAPASQQGLHKLLETHRAQTFLADEFAEWLGHAASDSHKQQALGHIMQAYGRAFGTLAAPAAVTNEYKPVAQPRVLIFATSTAERILETITASQGDSGALNRFVILAGEQDRLPKRYDVVEADYTPPASIVDLVAWIAALPDDTRVRFDDDAWELFKEHDAAVLDPLKFNDNRLAGRLNEQAFKLAGLIALSDRRTVIGARDLHIAYQVREGLYHRAASLIGHDGALSGMHPTGRAREQLRQHLEKKPFLYVSRLSAMSRQYAKLSTHEQEAVQRALVSEGAAVRDGARFVSQVFQKAAA